MSLAVALGTPALAQAAPEPDERSSHGDLASKLSNPVASMISVPLQSNVEFGIGPASGMRYLLNFQPVVPLPLGQHWNLITRTILPVVGQTSIGPGTETTGGLGDVLLSLFLSPSKPGPIIWGAGPALLFPTGTDDLLGNDKWGVGPTLVLLHQGGPWTIGILTNQVWSYAGDGDRQDVSRLLLQPFLAYNTRGGMTLTLNSETTIDWEADSGERTALPVNLLISQIAKLEQVLPVSFGIGAGYFFARTTTSPDWHLRFVVTLLLPQG